MKKLLLLSTFLFSTFAFSQSHKEDIDIIQSVYGKEKKEILASFVQVEETNKAAFWALYDEYEVKRKELGSKRIELLQRYASSYMSMDDATISQIMKETGALGVQTDKLLATYYKKMEKAAGVRAAAQFFQLEVYLLSAIRLTVMDNIPFIGELK